MAKRRSPKQGKAGPFVGSAIEGAKKILPDWLVDTVAPEEIDPSDVLNPMAIAAIPPRIARGRGEVLVQLIKEKGLPTGGMFEKAPNALIEALEFAQKRWPRLFGHIQEIRSTSDPAVRKTTSGPDIRGGLIPTKEGDKLSRRGVLALSPKPTGVEAETVGHELLHSADLLTQGEDFYDRYNWVINNLPLGYSGNSAEIRARLQGARTGAYKKGAKRREVADISTPLRPR